jgi:hypothetical protein
MFDVYATEFPLVRIGPPGDSGYVVPDVPGLEYYIGAGVGAKYNLQDDYDYMKHFGINDYLVFDATTKDVPDDHDPRYIRKNIGTENTPETTDLSQELQGKSNVFLKMDIENCEWNWILWASLDTLRKLKLIVMEMHFIGFPEELGDNDVEMFEKLAALKKLLRTHRIVHAHGNNYSPQVIGFDKYIVPSITEFTFLRKDLVSDEFSTTKLPIPGLDFLNDARLPPKDFVNIH